jgi:hypothetical protein
MSIRFTIRGTDLRRLRGALDGFRHPDREEQWIVFLEVTPSSAQFRFGDQAMHYPVNGQSPGFAKFPQSLIWQLLDQFLRRGPAKEVDVEIREGYLGCDQHHVLGDIEVGYFRNPTSGDIFYVRDAELVALRILLKDASVFGPEMQQHIKEASDRCALLIGGAAHTLRAYAIRYEDISHLITVKIAEMAPNIRARFDTLGMALWKN